LAINVTALVLGSLSLSEDKRIQRENATAIRRQGERVRTAGWRKFKELQRKAQTEQQEAERRQREQREEREAEERLQAALRKAQQQFRETEQRQYEEAKERESQRKRSEQAEHLRQAEQRRREAERRRRQAEEEWVAQRERQRGRKRAPTQFQSDWWIVLEVSPRASKDEIVRNYRRRIKQCHPDRMVGVAPELLHVAEEQTKALNGAYATAMRALGHARPHSAAA
jgi:DnaJ-domain-containing protein 1